MREKIDEIKSETLQFLSLAHDSGVTCGTGSGVGGPSSGLGGPASLGGLGGSGGGGGGSSGGGGGSGGSSGVFPGSGPGGGPGGGGSGGEAAPWHSAQRELALLSSVLLPSGPMHFGPLEPSEGADAAAGAPELAPALTSAPAPAAAPPAVPAAAPAAAMIAAPARALAPAAGGLSVPGLRRAGSLHAPEAPLSAPAQPRALRIENYRWASSAGSPRHPHRANSR